MRLRPGTERIAGVRRLLAAARTVYAERARLTPVISAATGLSPEGVELGFSCLECDPTDDQIGALIAGTEETKHVHVVLSANVFTAPFRALVIARAAAPRVTVRPSPRDPTLTEALLLAAGDPSLATITERDVAQTGATEIHVYGRDETIAAVRARVRPGVTVRSHGAGLGVAFVSGAASVNTAASAIARDVVPFDQRGCLSPRVVFAEGDRVRANRLAGALHEELSAWETRIPRGRLFAEEREDAARWIAALSFAGTVRKGHAHAVALFGLEPPGAGDLALAPLPVPALAPALPPAGRHLLVVPCVSPEDFTAQIAPFARFVVAIGSDDLPRLRASAPPHVRFSALGCMQRPPLDGSVDLRAL